MILTESVIACFSVNKNLRALQKTPLVQFIVQNICYLISAHGPVEIQHTHRVGVQYIIEMLYIITIGFFCSCYINFLKSQQLALWHTGEMIKRLNVN